MHRKIPTVWRKKIGPKFFSSISEKKRKPDPESSLKISRNIPLKPKNQRSPTRVLRCTNSELTLTVTRRNLLAIALAIDTN